MQLDIDLYGLGKMTTKSLSMLSIYVIFIM